MLDVLLHLMVRVMVKMLVLKVVVRRRVKHHVVLPVHIRVFDFRVFLIKGLFSRRRERNPRVYKTTKTNPNTKMTTPKKDREKRDRLVVDQNSFETEQETIYR